MPITFNGSGTVTRSSAGGLPDGCIVDADINGMASSKLSGALPAISGAALTGLSSGLDFASWRVDTNWSGGADPIQNFNPENNNVTMGYSSGIFSFPSTGYWHIMFQTFCYKNDDQDNIELHLMTTINNSSYITAALSYSHLNNDDGGNLYTAIQVNHIFDVTDVSTHKIKFKTANNTANFHTNASQDQSYAMFRRLADT